MPEDEHFIEIEDTPGYQSAYSQLAFAGKRQTTPLAHVTADPRAHLAHCLQKASVAHPGQLRPLVEQMEPQAKDFLNKYLITANASLS